MNSDQAFHHYIAALADDETANAAEIYANWISDPEFSKLVSIFDVVWSGFLNNKISIEFEEDSEDSIMEE